MRPRGTQAYLSTNSNLALCQTFPMFLSWSSQPIRKFHGGLCGQGCNHNEGERGIRA